jgi:flagellar motility protein MotE (MotC chaperone)
MIGRLVRGAWSLFVYTCVATVIAAGILLAYLSHAWHLDRDRLVQMLAIAYGIDLLAAKGEGEPDPKAAGADQASFDQVLDARANKSRNLELREQALQNSLGQLHFDQEKVVAEKKQFTQFKDTFYADLEKLQKGNVEGGIEENRRILESMKPKQAKELVAQMMVDNKLDEVVVLLTPMPDAKRAKILAEFKSPEDVQRVGELLRRLRDGAPVADKAEDARRTLDQSAASKP